VDRALDRIFAEPFDVPDAETAARLLSDTARPPAGAAVRFLEGQALVRIAGQVTKLVVRSRAATAAAAAARVALPASTEASATAAAGAGGAAMSTATSVGATAVAAAAVTAATRTTRTVRRGLTDLRVLASYLASRARRQQIELDKGLLRALTLAVYTDPRRRADFRYAGSKGASGVLGRWTRDTVANPSDARRRDDVTAWIAAIDRLNLPALAFDWQQRP
jgi:hypothetical protein